MKKIFLAELLQHYGMALTERQREIASLYYYDDLSLSEIAEALSVSRQAVASALSVARTDLQRYEQLFHHLQISAELSFLHSSLSEFVAENSDPRLDVLLLKLSDVIDLL